MNSSLWVDDFLKRYRSKNKMDSMERQLQLQLNKREAWANRNGLQLGSVESLLCVVSPRLILGQMLGRDV